MYHTSRLHSGSPFANNTFLMAYGFQSNFYALELSQMSGMVNSCCGIANPFERKHTLQWDKHCSTSPLYDVVCLEAYVESQA